MPEARAGALTRVISGAVLAAGAVAALLWLPPLALRWGLTALLALAAWEWMALAGFAGVAARGLAAALMAALFWPLTTTPQTPTLLLAPALTLWLPCCIWIAIYPRGQRFWEPRAVRVLLGVALLETAFGAAWYLHQTHGASALLWLLAVVAATDIGAYAIGRRWGRRPLSAVSPNKTRLGLAAGVVFGAAIAASAGISQDFVYAMGLTLAIFGAVCGDLLESMLKRRAGLKDSGAILPGHGGALDRLDSLIGAAPIFALCLMR